LSTQSNKTVADLDLATCRVLGGLKTLADVDFAGVIEAETVLKGRKGSKTRDIVPLSINVYGPLSSADRVGDALSALSGFLQHPFFLEPSCKAYFNPQMFAVGNEMPNLIHLVGLTDKDLKAKAISDEVENVLGSLDEIPSSGDLNSEGDLDLEASLVTSLKE
jgi:hypothetical protein